ncbi:enolase C-terminal domain-like protein [Companilactobacillus halodurans]|uniref:Mandelate racemase n=1 Tax=Companilactobacillus halodurans TaxID=2584183 RepID=A0A5P0ZYK1_9LACO|nr:enolase C-terminal domain-like protein [Companilactobacillus halodurans]MQS98173.1 mandelate racemase [Companilactobacillus halodurans]
MTRIVAYQIHKMDIPLKRPFITSIRTSNNLKGILYQVELDNGAIGFGESAENIKLTGESRDEMYRFAKDFFNDTLNQPIDDTLLSLQGFLNHTAARYGMEVAILDAMAKGDGLEISDELGLTLSKRTLENDTIVSVLSFEKTVSETKRILKKGYHHIKYKVVNNPDEIDRIIQLADIIPDDVSIRIDPNQSLNYFQTMEMINALDESTLNVEFIEQPVKSINYEDMKRISRQTKIPIIADESVFNLEDAKRIIENHYGSAINIKLIKSGGPLEVIELATFAKRHDVDCLFGCTIEANISMTMSAYLSAGLSNVKYIDLDGLDYIADSPFIGGIKDDHGQIMIPKQDNGLGISLLPNEALKYISDFINNYEV